MRSDAHPFICSGCKLVTPHIELHKYDASDIAEAPEEVWLVECQSDALCKESFIQQIA
jgi:hypothetical protein